MVVKKFIRLVQRKLEKEEIVSSNCFVIFFPLLLYNLNPPSSHSGSTPSSGFISASAYLDSLPLLFRTISGTCDLNLLMFITCLRPCTDKWLGKIICPVLANKLSCLGEKMCLQPPRNAGVLYCMNIPIKTMFAEERAGACVY